MHRDNWRKHSRCGKLLSGLCDSALDGLELRLCIRKSGRNLLLHGRTVASSSIEGREARLGGVRRGILGEVLVERDFDFGFLQSIVTAEVRLARLLEQNRGGNEILTL